MSNKIFWRLAAWSWFSRISISNGPVVRRCKRRYRQIRGMHACLKFHSNMKSFSKPYILLEKRKSNCFLVFLWMMDACWGHTMSNAVWMAPDPRWCQWSQYCSVSRCGQHWVSPGYGHKWTDNTVQTTLCTETWPQYTRGQGQGQQAIRRPLVNICAGIIIQQIMTRECCVPYSETWKSSDNILSHLALSHAAGLFHIRLSPRNGAFCLIIRPRGNAVSL